MNIVSIDNVALALKDGFLFEGLTLGIEEGNRIGLVGRNGAGKTSLLRLLAGELEADRGTIARKRGLTTAFLTQRPEGEPGWDLEDFLLAGQWPGCELLRRHDALLRDPRADGHALERARLALEESGVAEVAHRYRSYCSELGLDEQSARIGTLSGGQVKKAAIARALAPAADLVLLDEPTNHLDVETIEWLERRLLAAPFAFILVTHDRWFLDAACDSMLEIERRSVFRHPGNYAAYLGRKAERWASLEKAENRRLANLKIELEWLGRGARARAGKSERRKDLIRDMMEKGLERDAEAARFSSLSTRLGRKVVELVGAGKAYGEKRVLAPFSHEFRAGDRIGVVGPNGAGKTTLLDLVAGSLAPTEGRVERGETVRIATWRQGGESVAPGLSVIDYVHEKGERIAMADGGSLAAWQLLERFLFPRDFQGMAVSRLSGGERRRLELVRILAESPNFLILDEPTNDLDIDTIELLEDYLEGFPGCLLAVSHDRAFLDRVADGLIVLDGRGGAKSFVGGWAEWRAEVAARDAAGSAAPRGGRGGPAAADGVAAPEPPASARNRLSYAERKELGGILDEIAALEAEKEALEASFSRSPADAAGHEAASRRYALLLPLIEERTARWEALASREFASREFATREFATREES